jgi:hypothetical protein
MRRAGSGSRLALQNGFGAMLGTDVLCDVDKQDKRCQRFFIN